MKVIILILLVNIIFVLVYQIEQPIESSENLLSEEEIKKFRESLLKIKKIKRYLRKLELDNGTVDESSGEETPKNEVIISKDVSQDQVSENRNAEINIKKLNNFTVDRTGTPTNPDKPIILTFNLFIEFININPYKTIRFTLIIYRSGLRELQKNNENVETTQAICTRNDTFKDTSTKYECEADSTQFSENPDKIETVKDFEYTTDTNGDPVKLEAKHICFTPAAKKALEDITIPQSSNIHSIKIKEAISDIIDNPIFIIKGKLDGENNDKIQVVANKDKIQFTFHNGTIDGESINVECDVDDERPTNFVLKCDPKGFKGTLYLYQGNGTADDVDVFIETIDKENDKIKIIGPKDNNNIYYRKNSSGLSGGSIAGIVIACSVALIIMTILYK